MNSQFSGVFRVLSLALAGLTMLGLGSREGVAQPTPLVLKDGRIANVSVHSIPFQPGTAEFSASDSKALDGILIPFATDCFLTAQAIGHVEPEATGDDALDGHRLARARADAIQGRLINLGLPAASIASVWDWQFQVRNASATLWLFELAKGDDCEGVPLEAASIAGASLEASEAAQAPIQTAALAPTTTPAPSRNTTSDVTGELSRQATGAASPPATTPPVPTAPVATPPAVPPVAQAPEREQVPPASEQQVTPPREQAVTTTPAPVPTPAVEDEPAVELPPVATAELSPATAPATATAPTPAPAPTAQAAPEPVQKAALDPAPPAQSAPAASSGPKVVFDVNSSWLTPQLTGALDAILAGLSPGGAYDLTLTAAIGAGDVNSSNRAEDEKYNRWMAERRIAKVEGYLIENADGRRLQFEPDFRVGDNSRAVEFTIAPQR